jgi:hypothetical protein
MKRAVEGDAFLSGAEWSLCLSQPGMCQKEWSGVQKRVEGRSWQPDALINYV